MKKSKKTGAVVLLLLLCAGFLLVWMETGKREFRLSEAEHRILFEDRTAARVERDKRAEDAAPFLLIRTASLQDTFEEEGREPDKDSPASRNSGDATEHGTAPASVPGPAAGTAYAPDPGSGADGHTHQWADEIVTHHDAVTHVVHHDAVTEQRWVSVPVEISRFYCDVCHMEFFSQADAYAHEDATYQAAIEANDMSLIHSGHYSVEETVDQGYYETVTVKEAWDETVVDEPAWDEHRFRCTVCGATG